MEDTHHIALVSEKASLIEKIPYYLLALVTFLAPIFFIPSSFISFQFGTSLLFAYGVLISFLIYIGVTLVRGAVELPSPSKYIMGFLAIVPFVYVLSGIAGGFNRAAFFGYTFDIHTVGFIIVGFVYLFLVSIFFKNRYRIFHAYLAFLVSSLLLSIFIIIRIIFGADILDFGVFTNIVSTMVGSWNNVGIFFGIGALLSLLTCEMVHISRLMKILVVGALLLSLFFLTIVNFKALWMTLCVFSFLIALYRIFITHVAFSSKSFGKKVLSLPAYPIIVFIVSLVFVLWGNSIGGSIATKLNVNNLEVRPTFGVTLQIAKNTLSSKPLFGSGPNTFVKEWLTWKPNDITSSVFWNTDFTNGVGFLPTLLVTTGILGILSWVLFFGFYLYLGIKSIFSKIEDNFLKYLSTSSFFVSFYLWVMTLVYIPSTAIFILTLFFSGLFFASNYLAGTVKMESKVFSTNPKVGFLTSLLLICFLVGVVSVGYGLFQNSRSLWYFQKSFNSLSVAGDVDLAEKYMVRAIEIIPQDVYFRALSEIELKKLEKVISLDPKQVKPEEIQNQFTLTLTNAIKAGVGAKNQDSSNYLNWIALGKVYEAVSAPELKVEQAFESAQLAYGEALRLNPKNPGILMLFSRLAATRKDYKSAKTYALQAIQVKNNYLDAYFFLSQIEVADNNIKGAIESVTAASVINPTDSGIFFYLGLLKYNAKDFVGAAEALEKAITLTPDYANARYFLGLSYERIGKRAEAIEQFKEVQKTNPDNKDVNTILSNLVSGKSIFTNTQDKQPEKSTELPLKERNE